MLLIEAKELNHRFDLSGHELTLKPQHCKAQINQILNVCACLDLQEYQTTKRGLSLIF